MVTVHHLDCDFSVVTPLITAILNGLFEGIDALLHKGADIDARDNDGQTPLAALCTAAALEDEKDSKMADFLLRRGADETTADNDRRIPQELIGVNSAHTPIDLTDDKPDPERNLYKLLKNAPKDRVWRRRSWLAVVILRSRASNTKAKTVGAGDTGGGSCGEGSEAPRVEHAERVEMGWVAVVASIYSRVGLRRSVPQCGHLPLSYGRRAFFLSHVWGSVFGGGSAAQQ